MSDIERAYEGLEQLYAQVDNADGFARKGFISIGRAGQAHENYGSGMSTNERLCNDIVSDFNRLVLKLGILAAGLGDDAENCQHARTELENARRLFGATIATSGETTKMAASLLGAEDPITSKISELRAMAAQIDSSTIASDVRTKHIMDALMKQRGATGEIMKTIGQAASAFRTMCEGLPSSGRDDNHYQTPSEQTGAIASKEDPLRYVAQEACSLIADRIDRL